MNQTSSERLHSRLQSAHLELGSGFFLDPLLIKLHVVLFIFTAEAFSAEAWHIYFFMMEEFAVGACSRDRCVLCCTKPFSASTRQLQPYALSIYLCSSFGRICVAL